MILPSKGISRERSLIGIGSFILANIDTPRSSSELWHSYNKDQSSGYISFEWFCLAISLLFSMGLVDVIGGLLGRGGGSGVQAAE